MNRLFRGWAVDPPLVGAALALSFVGIATIYSAGVLNTPSFVTGIWMRQGLWLVVGLVAFTVLSRIPLRWFEWAAYPSYGVGCLLLAATLVIGGGRGTAAGQKSWIDLGGLAFQPAELAKIATVLALARFLASREEPPQTMRDLLGPSVLAAAPLGMIILQPDLGSALAFVGILFATLYWAGTPLLLLVLLASPGLGLILSFSSKIWAIYILLLVGLLVLYRYRLYLVESVAVILANLAAGSVALPLWSALGEYQRNRLLVYLDPSIDPLGAGYHVTQSKVAIGSGGLWGKGFTLGTQKRLDFLPEQHTDFVFSVIGEELGFLGTTVVVLLFGALLGRLVKLAQGAGDPFAGVVIFGIFGTWLVHIFINIGMTVGVVPITGIPLPFISYGGTFLLVSWLGVATAAKLGHED